ncbi:hypothetical protein AGR55_24220, partial [Salmonella enterica subsp. enterica serovar Typhimurium]
MSANRHPGGPHKLRNAITIGDEQWDKHLNEDSRKEAKWYSEQYVAKEKRSGGKGGNIIKIPVWYHRETEYQND